jgi:hypothetical protein
MRFIAYTLFNSQPLLNRNLLAIRYPAIVVLSIASQEPMHDSTNRACLALKQQSTRFGHETVGIEEEW